MSCFTRVATKLTDVEAIKEAAAELGYSLRKGKQVRGWSSRTTEADFVFATKTRYDVGAVRKKDGTYEFVCDWGMSGIGQKGFVEDISQRYGYVRLRRAAKKKGFTFIDRGVDNKGNVQVLLRKFV
jgi:hypothetical protein